MNGLTSFAGRIGGESSVFPAIRVRFSGDTYKYSAVARWRTSDGELIGRGRAGQNHSLTASENAVQAAWQAHCRLAEKVLAPRDGENPDFWARQLNEKVDPSRFVVFVADESDILPGAIGGGYLVSFVSVDSARVVPVEAPIE